jgi:prophage regulatory protein
MEAVVNIISSEDLPAKGITFTARYRRRLIEAGKFPKPFRLGERRLAWIEEEIDQWIAARVAARDAAPEPAETPEPQTEPPNACRLRLVSLETAEGA